MAETSTKPYMIRALYEWCCDNGYTPYLAVVVDDQTMVPRQHVKGGEIVLNVSPMATSRLTLGNERVEFQARFSGVAQQLSIPVGNISAIYARETGHGMAFEISRPAPANTADQTDPAHADSADRQGEPGGTATADGEGGDHSPASSVQSLRGGARRRGPRSVEPADAQTGQPSVEGEGADSRGGQGQGSADVLAFLPSGAPRKKKGAHSRAKATDADDHSGGEASPAPDGQPPEGGDEPPPSDGGGQGGKGSKARLTRVK